MKALVVTTMMLALTAPAHGMIPMLLGEPAQRTDTACQAWANAAAQDEVVAAMWGMTEEGIAQRKIAVTRLADHCLGRAVPEIVGISSSADAHHAYCANHKGEPVCRSGFGGLRP